MEIFWRRRVASREERFSVIFSVKPRGLGQAIVRCAALNQAIILSILAYIFGRIPGSKEIAFFFFHQLTKKRPKEPRVKEGILRL